MSFNICQFSSSFCLAYSYCCLRSVYPCLSGYLSVYFISIYLSQFLVVACSMNVNLCVFTASVFGLHLWSLAMELSNSTNVYHDLAKL